MPNVTLPEAGYLRRKDVFVINDIDLIVPPTNIHVQKEDLIWQWRALRSKASTKIPSGQGQIAVTVNIPFTSSMILDMHRLIVEFRHSPFCYIENRFLRETIVPHWAQSQFMAFTMTGLSVAPMQGTSNTWVMQLDLTWFNYQPYLHNFLYRKEWATVPLNGDSGLESTENYQMTIGWGWKDGVKVPRRVVLPNLLDSAVPAVREWDAVQSQFDNVAQLSIQQMETLHRGEIFDLSPLPNRMEQAEFVSRPLDSRIYVRYINYLQRDALLKNFGIDVERDMGFSDTATPVLHSAFFNAVKDGEVLRTYPLHAGPVVRDNQIYRDYIKLKRKWNREMNSLHGQAIFSFASYSEIRMPQTWNEGVGRAHQHAIEKATEGITTVVDGGSEFITTYSDVAETSASSRIRVRRGWSSPVDGDGKYRSVPVGKIGEAGPMSVADALESVVSEFSWRSAETINRIYGTTGMSGRMHWGTDFSLVEGSSVHAVETGHISSIKLNDNSNYATWKYISPDSSKKAGYDLQPIADGADFKNSLLAIDPSLSFRGFNVESNAQGRGFPVGTFVKSLVFPGWYIVRANSAGNRIQMSHGANLSMYYHLSDISEEAKVALSNGTEISAGTLIGYVGGSGPLSSGFVLDALSRAEQNYVQGDPETAKYVSRTSNNGKWLPPGQEKSKSLYHLGNHLHFEYWESQSYGAHRDAPYDDSDGVPEDWRWSSKKIPVDPLTSMRQSVQSASEITPSAAARQLTRESVKEEVGNDEELTTSEATGVIDLLNGLWQDNWLYYDRDSQISNVWWKHFHLNIQPGNRETLGEGTFISDNVVLTAVAGGLRHVVANIPILGYEFPTQQHLGSVEPFYSFEFCSIDSEGQGDQRLAGISKNAELLIGMRSMLHSNARNFRPITDSWAVACNSFITRLLGTHQDEDVTVSYNSNDNVDLNQEEEKVIADIELKRRLIATRGSSMTVEGHPGLSCHTLEFMETNPYEGEAITSTAPNAKKIEEARCELLSKLYAFEFQEKYQDVANAVLVASLSGADVSSSALSNDGYGQFSMDYVTSPSSIGSGDIALIDAGGRDYIISGDDLSNAFQGNAQAESVPGFPDLQGIPLSAVFPEGTSRPVNASTKNSYGIGTGLGEKNGGQFGTKDYERVSRNFDISGMLTETQDALLAADIPMSKILDYWVIVHKTIRTANMLLAEDQEQLLSGNLQPGGTSINTAYNELYCLPVIPSLFKSYQHYLEGVSEINPKFGPDQPDTGLLSNGLLARAGRAIEGRQNLPETGEATAWLRDTPNWLAWDEQYKLTNDIKRELEFGFSQGTIAFGEAVLGTTLRGTDFVWDTVTGGVDRILRWSSFDKRNGTFDQDEEGIYASFWTENLDSTYTDVAKNYMFNLPLQYLLEDRFKNYVTSSLFGDLLGGIDNAEGSPVFANTTTQLKNITATCGEFQFSPFVDMPMYVVSWNKTKVETLGTGADVNVDDDQAITAASRAATGAIPVPILKPDSNTWAWTWFNGLENIYAPHSPFIWFVDAAVEQKKVLYFKSLFARYADDMMRDPDILRAFGLESYAHLNRRAKIQGSPALPDMDLPWHPYYGTLASCPADFYMWNIYEDGNAYGSATQAALDEAMQQVVTNCYNSMKRVEGGELYQPDKDDLVLEPAFAPSTGGAEKLQVPTGYQAEGSDTTKKGPTAFPFYPSPESNDAISKHFSEVEASIGDAKTNAKTARLSGKSDVREDLSISKSEARELASLKVDNIRLSNGEGPYGQGGGVNYPRRLASSQYEDLATQVAGLEQMFGSRSGYLSQKELPDDVKERTAGTALERQEIPTHAFDVSSLQSLAKQSSQDLLGQKRVMKRAYPTFKLFFVEEDEFESRLLNFDDFYSYNGVTSFTVEQSRKSPADHAVISLLNVAGTLDGTKRDAVVDLDYYGEFSKTKIPDHNGSTRGGDAVATNTALDQPFGALVLRPGLNVQLRCGYSNDPDQLEVLINGRVVDVTWNSGGDRAEIMVQSFGTELIQAIKGTSAGGDGVGIPTTHQLLGSMMLEPELVHFGRWEFGQLYQIGEAGDSRLDFRDYSREAFLGRFKHSNNMTKWFLDHPVITASLAIGGTAALARIPGVGRILRPIGALGQRAAIRAGRLPWVGRWFTKLATAAEVGALGTAGPGATGYTKAAVRTAGRGTTKAITAESAALGATQLRTIVRAAAGRSQALIVARAQSPAMARKVVAIQNEAFKRAVGSKSISSQAAALAKGDALVQNLILKGQWMSKPLAQLGAQGVGLMSAIGAKPLSRVWGGLIRRAPILVGGAAVAGLAADAFDWMLTPIYNATIGRLKAYFQTKKVSLFLSPQDDNLFPPHPKDYMEIYDSTASQVWSDIKGWVVKTGVSAFIGSDDLGYQAARWFTNTDPLDKRVPVEACKFIPMSTTIWDVFHEMSLRHPGWVYGTRPYGHQFRYTMFFGVPSQRYWSRGADNEFIARANDVQRLLTNQGDDPDITLNEFRRLYGDEYDTGTGLISLNQFSANLVEEAKAQVAVQGHTLVRWAGDYYVRETKLGESEQPVFEQSETNRFEESANELFGESQTEPLYSGDGYLHGVDVPLEDSSIYKAVINHTLTTRALEEYMLALSQRFVPFRRYHSITSEHDLVWNGLMSSENAVYNAVDVTYFETDAEIGDSPLQSSLFKAHAFIPEQQLRVLPLEPSYNCRGYQMAMRYGQGTLLHTMRDMYRGELIVLGNPRIRPWDVAILSDAYNDMVGPVEVEQVVHQFSHETGFITEIKPCAMVIANETSSWPVLEAMKVMSLATRDIEDQYQGLRAGDAGWKFRTTDWILGMGAGANQDYVDYLEERAAALRPFDPFSEAESSDLKALEDIEDELNITGRKVMTGIRVGAGVIAAGLAYKTAPFLLGSTSKVARILTTGAAGGGIYSALGGGILGAVGIGEMFGSVTPSLTWLLGGPVLFLSCLRGDSIMLIPLMKNGHPIVSGLNLSDPSMMWNNFKGELGRWVDDTVEGTKDMTELWRMYGQHAWRRNNAISKATTQESDVWDENRQLYAELTGEEK